MKNVAEWSGCSSPDVHPLKQTPILHCCECCCWPQTLIVDFCTPKLSIRVPSLQALFFHGVCASPEALQQAENISIVISEMTNACCEIEVSSDNAAALHMVRNGSETAWRTRHISVKALWLHQMSRRGI